MRVVVDGSPLFRKLDGVGRYTSSLIKELVHLDADNQYKVIRFWGDKLHGHAPKNRRADYVTIPMPRKVYALIFKRFGLSVNRWLPKKVDVVFYPNFIKFPRIKDVKSIVVIHDLAFLEAPKTVADKNLDFLSKHVPRSVRDADAIVAVSEETQKSIAKHFGINASDITVVPNAVDNQFFASSSLEELNLAQQRYGLPDQFILHVGTIEPRKNIVRLVEAYTQLPANIRERYPLVLAGKRGWKSDKIFHHIHEALEQGHTILPIGFVANKYLPALYKLASLLVFPSIHEGFGLPILEAFAAGTPVVTSNLPPMNQIGKDAAIFVNPEQPGSIATGIKSLLSNQKLRDRLIKHGRETAKRYSWHESALKLKKLIEEIGKDE